VEKSHEKGLPEDADVNACGGDLYPLGAFFVVY
jgi:hypothetical protein